MNYLWDQSAGFFFLYAFLGWAVEAAFYALTRRKFINRGFLTLPFILSYGWIFLLMIVLLPTLGDHLFLQFVMTLIISTVVDSLCRFAVRKLSPDVVWTDRANIFGGSMKGFSASLIIAALCYAVYLILHPLLLTVMLLLPVWLLKITVCVIIGLTVLDFIMVCITLRKKGGAGYAELSENSSETRLADRISHAVWMRLRRAYPGLDTAETLSADYTFAQGLSRDKIVWVFFLCALLGDGIETLYCGLVDGAWMSRSSVLYGPFSFVWGIGAVILTITLLPLVQKNDRWIFFAGFVIGGAYEYMCSVFTEMVFGTVFWDYSDMPLNIGGRTNVLFCFFWGVLAMVWVKLIYPRLSGLIEKIPPVAGKVITWVIVLAMSLNALLTVSVMLRYNIRKVIPESTNMLEELIDMQYPDARIEARWPNMIVVE